MKILKYGEGYPKTILCDECESTLEYDNEDIKDKLTRVSEPDPCIEYIDYIEKYLVCPVCNHNIVLNSIYFSTKYKEIPNEKPEKKKKKWWQK